MTSAIASIENAIKSMRDSKGAMTGAKVDFAQIASTMQQVMSVATSSVASKTSAQIASLSKQKPAGYEYHSNDIINTLMDLYDTFLANKKEADEAEFALRSAH